MFLTRLKEKGYFSKPFYSVINNLSDWDIRRTIKMNYEKSIIGICPILVDAFYAVLSVENLSQMEPFFPALGDSKTQTIIMFCISSLFSIFTYVYIQALQLLETVSWCIRVKMTRGDCLAHMGR